MLLITSDQVRLLFRFPGTVKSVTYLHPPSRPYFTVLRQKVKLGVLVVVAASTATAMTKALELIEALGQMNEQTCRERSKR